MRAARLVAAGGLVRKLGAVKHNVKLNMTDGSNQFRCEFVRDMLRFSRLLSVFVYATLSGILPV
jgi:hypothetical protein